MSDQALKPCPFCGGKGVASERTCDKDSPYNPNDRAYPVVRCSTCFTTIGGKDWSPVSTAIDAWNRRVPTSQAEAKVAELEARIERLREDVHTAWSAERECRERLAAIETVCRRLVARRNSEDGYTILTIDVQHLEELLADTTDATVHTKENE